MRSLPTIRYSSTASTGTWRWPTPCPPNCPASPAPPTTLDKGRWVLNGNWDHERWTPADLPTRQLIDAVTPDNPVFINRLDGHMALANSLALELAGITRDTPDPPGGSIVRDADGEPTGVLKDAAMNAVYAVIPEASPAEIAIALRAAMREANENGVTSVQDMSASPDILRTARTLRAHRQ